MFDASSGLIDLLIRVVFAAVFVIPGIAILSKKRPFWQKALAGVFLIVLPLVWLVQVAVVSIDSWPDASGAQDSATATTTSATAEPGWTDAEFRHALDYCRAYDLDNCASIAQYFEGTECDNEVFYLFIDQVALNGAAAFESLPEHFGLWIFAGQCPADTRIPAGG